MRKGHVLLFTVALMTGAFGLPAGCSGANACVRVCNEVADCAGVETLGEDCAVTCNDQADAAADAGCSGEFGDYWGCLDSVDACAALTLQGTGECLEEGLALAACMFTLAE